MKLLLVGFVFLSFQGWASDLCSRTKKETIELLEKEPSRIAFRNGGGLFNGGVCWWHSRLQRTSAYLVKFAPTQPKESEKSAAILLEKLRKMETIVEIRGYSDFETFTHDHQKTVLAFLERWQRIDGFLNQQWLRGLSGRSHLPPNDLKRQMDHIYSVFQNSKGPLWLMAQMKGITSHALLLLDMVQTNDGHLLRVIDSNRPLETRELIYSEGDVSLKFHGEGHEFVPYIGFQKDMDRIESTLKASCLR